MSYHSFETGNGTTVKVTESAINNGDLALTLQAGNLTIRAQLDETTATRLATAINAWYFSKYYDTQHYGSDPLPIDEMDDWLNPTTPLPGTVATNEEVAVDLTNAYHIHDAGAVADPVTSHDFYDTIREYRSGRDNVTYTTPGGQP